MATGKDINNTSKNVSEFDGLISELKYQPTKNLTKAWINKQILQQNSSMDANEVLTELVRLTSLCHNTLDLRWKVKGLDVSEVSILDKTHFTDPWTAKFLVEEIKRYGLRYTVGAYESAKEFFRDNRQLLLDRQKASDTPIEIHKFCTEFRRAEERMFFAKTVSLCQLNIDENVPQYIPLEEDLGERHEAVTSNISKSGLKLRVATNLGKTGYLVVRFDSLEQELVFSQSNIIYKIIHNSKDDKDNVFDYFLELQKNECNQEFAGYLKNLIYSHKHKYKVDLDGIVDAAYAKSCENYFTNTTNQIDFFTNKRGELKYVLEHPDHAFCLNYFEDSAEQVVKEILARSLRSESQSTYLFCARGTTTEGGDTSQTRLVMSLLDKESPNDFYASLAQFKDTKSATIFKVTVSKFDPRTAFRTSSIPKESQEAYGSLRINRHADNTKKSISGLAYHLSFQPIDRDRIFDIVHLDKFESKNAIRTIPLKQGGSPAYKHIFRETDEKRLEDRFSYATSVSIEFNNHSLHGKTKNVSCLGLCVLLDRSVIIPEGATVTVSFLRLAERTTIFDLMRCKYDVIQCNSNELRLSNRAYSSHDGKEFWHRFIGSKLEQISVIENSNEEYGISRALENISLSNFSDSAVFFKQINKKPFATVFIDNGIEIFQNYFALDEKSIRQWFYHQNVYPNLIHVLDKKSETRLILTIDYQRTLEGYIIEDVRAVINDVKDSEQVPSADIEKIRAGEQLVYQLQLRQTGSHFSRYNTDEINYIKRFSPYKSEDLDTKIQSVRGVFLMTNITDLFD